MLPQDPLIVIRLQLVGEVASSPVIKEHGTLEFDFEYTVPACAFCDHNACNLAKRTYYGMNTKVYNALMW